MPCALARHSSPLLAQFHDGDEESEAELQGAWEALATSFSDGDSRAANALSKAWGSYWRTMDIWETLNDTGRRTVQVLPREAQFHWADETSKNYN